MSPFPAQRLWGGAAPRLRPRDCVPPTRSRHGWPGPALPQSPPTLPTRRPTNKSYRETTAQK